MVNKGLTRSLECARCGEANFKIFAVLKLPQQIELGGSHMEMIGIFGFVFAATTTGRLVYEHQTDVLHGPYIEGRERTRVFAGTFAFARAVGEAFVEHLNWKVRDAVYLASLA